MGSGCRPHPCPPREGCGSPLSPLQHLPSHLWPAGSRRSFAAPPGGWDGQGRRLAGRTRGSCGPPEPPGTSPEPPPCPPGAQGWHLRPAPPCSATKGRDARDERSNPPHPPGVLVTRGIWRIFFLLCLPTRGGAVSFYSPSGWECQRCEAHQVRFTRDGAGEVTALGPCGVLEGPGMGLCGSSPSVPPQLSCPPHLQTSPTGCRG